MSENSHHPQLYRQSQMAIALQTSSYSALALNPGPSLKYLTGLDFHLMERPVLAIFVPHTPLIMILPELEAAKVDNMPYAVQAFTYGEDPDTWQSVFKQAIRAAGLAQKKTIGVEPRRLRLLELRLLEGASPEAEFVSAEKIIASLRMKKDESELEAMRKAVEIAQDAIRETLPLIKIGASEKEIAAELTLQLLRGGSEPKVPFSPIVSSGPNSANPHATPTRRQLQPGDCLVIDWGATYLGYLSDITRTFAVAEIDTEMVRVGQIVQEANAAANAVAGPGVLAGEVDEAARQVIDQAKYGKYFIHRTGHGLGLEAHEEPYIRSSNPLPLQPGMTFTIEPGIYLPNRNGVRIEDNVVVTSDGIQSLTDLPRNLIMVG